MTFARITDVAASWAGFDAPTSLPPGLMLYLAGPTEEGVRIIEMWASRTAWAHSHAELDVSADLPGHVESRDFDVLLELCDLAASSSRTGHPE